MALERGTTYIELRAQLDQLRRDLAQGEKLTTASATKVERTMGQRLSAFSARTASMARTMSTRLALPLIGLGAVAVNEFSEVQKVSAQTDAALESTAGVANLTRTDIESLAASIGQLSAVDAEQVQAAENVLLTFTKLRNEVGEGNDIFNQATLSIADMSARLGQDMQSSAIQLGKALNDPIKGITALSRVGVSFTEGQREQITALVESNDVLGAQKIILAELQTEFGGSAKAAGAAASPVDKLKLTFNDFAESLGESLMPILQDLAEILKVVGRWFSNLSPGMRKFIVILGGVALAAGPATVAISAIGTALALLMSPIGLAVAAAAGLAIVIVKNWSKIKEVTGAVWDWVYGKLKWFWDWILKWNPAVILARLIIDNFGRIKSVAGAVWDWMADKVNWVIDRIRTAIGWIGKAIDAVRTLIGATASFGQSPAVRQLIEQAEGGGGVGAGPLGNNLVEIGNNLQSQGFRVTGHPAFPPIGGHTQGSLHYIGRAIDVNWGAAGESPEEKLVLNSLAAKLRATVGGISELIFPATGDPDHQDHLHLAMDRGGIVRGPATIHQGAITEAHIPLTGPGAGGMRISGVLEIPGLGRAILRGAQLTVDQRNHSDARASRWQASVAT